MVRTPGERVAWLERHRAPPGGEGERFAGYGVNGLPFRSGHVLALRRTVASSIGPPSATIWHREPGGRWTFYTDVEPSRSCPRYHGSAVDRVVVTEISVRWTDGWSFSVRAPARRLHWAVRLRTTPVTRGLNALGRLLPDAAWRRTGVLTTLSVAAGRALGVGRLDLTGCLANGQSYRLQPGAIWRVEGSAAMVEGVEVGAAGPLPVQAEIGGYPVPNGGIFTVGLAYHDTFDPDRHDSTLSREGVVRGEG